MLVLRNSVDHAIAIGIGVHALRDNLSVGSGEARRAEGLAEELRLR